MDLHKNSFDIVSIWPLIGNMKCCKRLTTMYVDQNTRLVRVLSHEGMCLGAEIQDGDGGRCS